MVAQFFFFYWAPVASASGSTATCRLIVQARLWKFPLVPPEAPTTTTRETSSRERGNYGREMSVEFFHQIASSTTFEGNFYMQHGTNGFTPPLKEGMLRFFLP
jgi:hypothetical protein